MAAREACRAMGLGAVHSRVNKLADRVAVLLAATAVLPQPPPPDNGEENNVHTNQSILCTNK